MPPQEKTGMASSVRPNRRCFIGGGYAMRDRWAQGSAISAIADRRALLGTTSQTTIPSRAKLGAPRLLQKTKKRGPRGRAS
jgi:hypothetical protein